MSRKLVAITLIGLVSGIATELAEPVLNRLDAVVQDSFWLNGPGFFFAIAFGGFFLVASSRKWWAALKTVALIIISSLAYSAAIFTTIQMSESSNSKVLGFFPGGAVGALIFFLAVRFLFYPFSIKQLILLIFSGGVLGFLVALGGNGSLDALYIIWQTGMAFIAGWCMERNSNFNRAAV